MGRAQIFKKSEDQFYSDTREEWWTSPHYNQLDRKWIYIQQVGKQFNDHSPKSIDVYMFTGINFSTTLAITVFFMVEYLKSKVSGGFIYLKPSGRNNLSHSNFMLQCETVKALLERFSLWPQLPCLEDAGGSRTFFQLSKKQLHASKCPKRSQYLVKASMKQAACLLDAMNIRVPRKTLKSPWTPWRTEIQKHRRQVSCSSKSGTSAASFSTRPF